MGSDKNDYSFLKEIGLDSTNIGGFIDGKWKASGSSTTCVNPLNNKAIAKVTEATVQDYEELWMTIPAPERGEIVRQIGDALRAKLGVAWDGKNTCGRNRARFRKLLMCVILLLG